WWERNHALADVVLRQGDEVWIASPEDLEAHRITHPDELIRPLFQVRRVKLIGGKKNRAHYAHYIAWLSDPRFDRLESLDLAGMDDLQDLGFLGHVAGLKELNLSRCNLDDAKLGLLPKISSLRRLSLNGNDLGAPTAFHLANTFPELEELHLSCPRIGTDAALHLAKLQSLKRLTLSGGNLTDPGLRRLTALRNLEELDIRDTKVTPAGVAEFQKALPNCKVVWQQLPAKD
ncbi:MAG: hypothetical protein NZM31_06310, partial [Gemmatales bacterium]|nr:hypothetical protein [Gemmatales bacterium]MDW8386612.1 hypothetical protein [Gemmatales bacterium]